jgi:hypothetical protein
MKAFTRLIAFIKAFIYANKATRSKRDHGLEWFDDRGRLHRGWGLPSVVSKRGYRAWHSHGVQHRRWGPAVKDPDGTRLWYRYSLLHRAGGKPAVIRPNGRIEYWEHGRKHREDGPAVITEDGWAYWYKKGHMVRCERV